VGTIRLFALSPQLVVKTNVLCSNKWNPFERIKTLDGLSNEQGFTIMWDRSKSNSYYVTERMYYYLDKDKHREKYKSIRAKLYITRLHQLGMGKTLTRYLSLHISLILF